MELDLDGKYVVIDGNEYKNMVQKLEAFDSKQVWIETPETDWGGVTYVMSAEELKKIQDADTHTHITTQKCFA